MTLREEFEKEVNSLNITNVDKLFRTGATEYIQWLESKIKIKDNFLNIYEKTNLPQIHLSATDGKTKEEATELVFHKMADDTLFVEWYLRSDLQYILNCSQLQANFDIDSKIKLVEFLNSDTTY